MAIDSQLSIHLSHIFHLNTHSIFSKFDGFIYPNCTLSLVKFEQVATNASVYAVARSQAPLIDIYISYQAWERLLTLYTLLCAPLSTVFSRGKPRTFREGLILELLHLTLSAYAVRPFREYGHMRSVR